MWWCSVSCGNVAWYQCGGVVLAVRMLLGSYGISGYIVTTMWLWAQAVTNSSDRVKLLYLSMLSSSCSVW